MPQLPAKKKEMATPAADGLECAGALCIVIVMIGAIKLVHLQHGFDIGRGGYEYVLTQLLIAIAILVAGARKFSLAPKKIATW